MKSAKQILCLLIVSAAMHQVLVAEGPKPEERSDYDQSKDVGLEAPLGATKLFDGTEESIVNHWIMWPNAEMSLYWTTGENPAGEGKVLMTAAPENQKWGTHDLVTRTKYRDFEGHVEFIMMGRRGDGKIEGYCNSGVYLQNRHEIQIESPKGEDALDPYSWNIGPHGIGAFCLDRVPDHNVWRPNGEWHAFHFIFKAAKYDGDELVEHARATVWWNGVKIHDNAVVKKLIPRAGIDAGPEPGGIKLQHNGKSDVRFRNIWIVEK